MKRFLIKYYYTIIFINHSCTNVLRIMIYVVLNQKSFQFRNVYYKILRTFFESLNL